MLAGEAAITRHLRPPGHTRGRQSRSASNRQHRSIELWRVWERASERIEMLGLRAPVRRFLFLRLARSTVDRWPSRWLPGLEPMVADHADKGGGLGQRAT